jgi:4-hydroxyphenylpyruvate dioxygenase-like putative hemolysin
LSVCPQCGTPSPLHDFDAALKEGSAKVRDERKKLGLEGLTGGLDFIIINAEDSRHLAAASEIISTTGFNLKESFEDENYKNTVLSIGSFADIVVQSRKSAPNPFSTVNCHPLSAKLPNTRLETLVFKCYDLEKYVSIQKARGIKFITDDICRTDKYLFIQTKPSQFTGNSIGFIERKGPGRDFVHSRAKPIDLQLVKPDRLYLKNIKQIDHIATRVTSADRDPAILEFMRLTDYNFEIAVYIEELNSITNVSRLSRNDFALVFTSGISAYVDDNSGPTEKFVHNYGARVHHMAFNTEYIEETYDALAHDGQRYLIKLVGSEPEGLKQTFTVPSANTMIVNEYIHRYGDFDGFFTKNNVTKLTAASDYIPND